MKGEYEMIRRLQTFLSVVAIVCPFYMAAQPALAHASSFLEERVPKPWLTLEYQIDTRNFNTLNFTGKAPLLFGFYLSGFTDIESPKQNAHRRFDFSTSFLELDLLRHVWQGLGIIAELNSFSGTPKNDKERLGIYYVPNFSFLKKIYLNLFFKAFPYETDSGRGQQLSWSYGLRMPYILGDRISFSGFMDFNLGSGTKNNETNVVTDHQFRFRLFSGLRLLIEYRHSDFLSAIKDTNNGVGFGLQFKF